MKVKYEAWELSDKSKSKKNELFSLKRQLWYITETIRAEQRLKIKLTKANNCPM